MNPVHIHLLLNHVAILACLFSVVILAYGLLRKNTSIINLALVGLVIAALTAIPVFLTGEPAEEAVEHLPGITEVTIEEHEEAAETAIWLIEITGIVALGGLLLRKVAFFTGNVYYGLVLVMGLAAGASIAYTGFEGGKIRHNEINSVNAPVGTDQVGPAEHEEEDD